MRHPASRQPQPPDAARDASRTEAQLRSVKAEIERIAREVSEAQVQRDRLAQDLRAAEGEVGKARTALEALRRARAERAAQRARLEVQRRAREADLWDTREVLAGELRAAYRAGHGEPLQLLLNQRDPPAAARMLAYYGYIGRARARRVASITADLEEVQRLDAAIAAEDAQLAQLEQARGTQLSALEQARAQRSRVLVALEQRTQEKSANLARLREQQAGLEKLLRDLREALARAPAFEGGGAFAQAHGHLAWPAPGRVVARFGESRAGAIRWDGVLLATERGVPVRAVYAGRVVYADWLPGLGLLTIIDHGSGYMTLYGHAERLLKAAGERVATGEAIAAAGDSGGSSRPELYFEIRKAGRPVDPRPWFRSAAP